LAQTRIKGEAFYGKERKIYDEMDSGLSEVAGIATADHQVKLWRNPPAISIQEAGLKTVEVATEPTEGQRDANNTEVPLRE
jgi:hypothetical protein